MLIITEWLLENNHMVTFWNTECIPENLEKSDNVIFIMKNKGRVHRGGKSTGKTTFYYGYKVTVNDYKFVDGGVILTTSDGHQLFAGKDSFKKNKTYTKATYNDYNYDFDITKHEQNYQVHKNYQEAVKLLKGWSKCSTEDVELCEGGLPKDQHKCTFRKRKGKILWTCKITE